MNYSIKVIFLTLISICFINFSFGQTPADSTAKAKKLYQKGLAEYENQEYEAAIATMKTALEYNNTLDSAYVIMAKAEFDSTTVKDYFTYMNYAAGFFNPIRLNPKAEYFAERGWYFYLLEDYNNAIEDLDSAIVRKPNTAEFYYKKSIVYLDYEDPEQALENVDKALALEKRDIDFLEQKANILIGMGRIEEAEKGFKMLIELDENFYEAYSYLGYIYQMQRNIEQAIIHYKKAIEINPAHIFSHQNLSLLYMWQNEHDEAKKHLYKILEIDSNSTQALLHLSAILERMDGKIDEALIYVNKCLEIEPNDGLANEFKGHLLSDYYEQDKEAVSYFKKAIEAAPSMETPYINLASSLIKLNEWNEADGYLRQVLEKEGDILVLDEVDFSNIGFSFLQMKNYVKAIESLDRSIELNPTYPYSYNNRAFCKIYLNDFKGAKEDAETSKSLDPNNSYVYFTLAGIAAKEGDKDTFYKELEKAIELGFPIQKRLDEAFLEPFLEEERFKELIE